MINTSINSIKTMYKEDELTTNSNLDKPKKKLIPVEDQSGNPCELEQYDVITVVRKNGKSEDYEYQGECIKYKEFGHWYFTSVIHNKNDYCNIYTDKGSVKYLALLSLSNFECTHISEEGIEKIVRLYASPKKLSAIKRVKSRKNFEGEYSYVLCTEYGTNGLIPTTLNCEGSCLSSSGDSACGGYFGDEEIPYTNLHVVTCTNNMECLKNRDTE